MKAPDALRGGFLGPVLQRYFCDYLINQRQQTTAVRDAIRRQAIQQLQRGNFDLTAIRATDHERIESFAESPAAVAINLANDIARDTASNRHERRQ